MSRELADTPRPLRVLNEEVWRTMPDGLVAHCDAGRPIGHDEHVECTYVSRGGRWTVVGRAPAPLGNSYAPRALMPDYFDYGTRRTLLLTNKTPAGLRAAAVAYYESRRAR